MIRQEPMPAAIKTAAPIKQANTLVSPIDPGIVPKKESHQVIDIWATSAEAADALVAILCSDSRDLPGTAAANWPKAVAPEYPSTPLSVATEAAVQTRSPLI